ncbi:nicotinate-nucleotide adenylyltransferase [Paenibacillus sp. MBLB4367]|uniref:nicotinate-nucleotide adenylyltransferase n=1 Tax=Paenibacillus sp. MBLB4367 TaxID=3384767 RepID=UPI003907E836
MKKVGIMGGTFDPIHLGHLIAAEEARSGAGLDEVWFMPSNVPPHKPNAPKASPSERLDMVREAIEGHPMFRAIDIELTLGGTSYTSETMAVLRGLHPDIVFSYIIGADMVMYLPKWHQIGELVRQIGFIGLQRPGYDLQPELLPDSIRDKVTLVPMIPIELSSTEIRERMRTGRAIRFLVPEPVRTYIERNGLYES